MTIEEYRRAVDAKYLPITLERIAEIVEQQLAKPCFPGGVRGCACRGAEPMIRAIVNQIREEVTRAVG
jgi:hypothetical protein